MSDILSVSEAQQLILSEFSPTESTSVILERAFRRVLADDVCAGIDLPPFANSSMDGFAVRAEDLTDASKECPVSLIVVGDIPAGHTSEYVLKSGQAVRIMTGGPIPLGSDAVVPVEETHSAIQKSGEAIQHLVEIRKTAQTGDYIRPKGQDVTEGEIVLPRGKRLSAQDVGLIAMLGISNVVVHRQPRVAVFSSGDELLLLGQQLSPGKIFNSNSYMLIDLVEKYGGEVFDLGIAADTFESVQGVIGRGVSQNADLILSTAGVSIGEYDYVRLVLEKQGELGFWRVNMRPGKPLTFGHYQNIPFIGLPGNPVSAFVGFEVFVRPVLMKLAGVLNWKRPTIGVTIDEPIQSDGRESFLRAIVQEHNGEWRGKVTGHQGSGNLRSLVQANALLLIPSGVKSLPIGSQVKGWLLDD